MSYVITLMGAAGSDRLIAATAEDLCTALPAAEKPGWLSGQACDIAFRPSDEAALNRAQKLVEAIPEGQPLDSFLQPAANRRKRMLMADMDSTIIEQECLDEVAAAAGIGEQIAAITERAMRGELPFEDALRERIGLLQGFPAAGLQAVLDERISLTPGARTVTATMRAHGGRAVLVSGGFTFFTRAIAAKAGFDADYANRFLIEDGKIAGAADPILGRDAKLSTMKSETARLGISLDDVIAVGDGANDLAMLQAAGLGVAFRAKPVVAEKARAKINHSGLIGLLFLQGYSINDFSAEDPEY